MLNISTINQYYRESHTLWDLSLEVPKGSVTCLMGRNGVGKTTLLKCIMGLETISDGSIKFKDIELSKINAEKRAIHKIAYVPIGKIGQSSD